MNDRRKSDDPVVPEKPSNEALTGAEEMAEERGSAKGNSRQRHRGRTQRRTRSLQTKLKRIRQAAKRDKEEKFTALWHHVYDPDRLKATFQSLRKDAAAGVDARGWRDYAKGCQDRVDDLSARLKRGGYRPAPVRRTYIPKADGKIRALGIPTIEDKIVQKTTAQVLEAIYEVDFLGFSYGFRQGRGPHNALDAVVVGIEKARVNYVLDADIRGFFDAIDHEWLIRFIEHRVGDQRVIRQIRKWLKAGVLEEGKLSVQDKGTPQGGPISPLLANIYLHYVLDLWADAWRDKRAQGKVIIVRYADDFVVGFESRSDAERFEQDLIERFKRFGLELHSDKTRLIEFGRYAAERRRRRGESKPESFEFLGFTHTCSVDSNGYFVVKRETSAKRMRAKLKEVAKELNARLHQALPEVGKWLGQVLEGHMNYFGVVGNVDRLRAFRRQLTRQWKHALRKRSQRSHITWERMRKLREKYLPQIRIVHPLPHTRLNYRPT